MFVNNSEIKGLPIIIHWLNIMKESMLRNFHPGDIILSMMIILFFQIILINNLLELEIPDIDQVVTGAIDA